MAGGLRRASRSTGRRTLFLATLLAVLVVLLNVASGGRLSALARDIVAPVSDFGGRVGEGFTQSGYFSSRRALEAQIAALQSEVQQSELQAAAFQAVEEENASLAALTHLARVSQGLAAPIISSVISSPYGTFTIGAGSADGVAQGDLVLSEDGFVVGKVAQVQSHQSLVDEIFAPSAQVPVTIGGAATIALGEGADAQAEVPHGVAVSQGDPVVAPEYEARSVGVVEYVNADPAGAQQAVYIALPVSLSSLEYVYVTP